MNLTSSLKIIGIVLLLALLAYIISLAELYTQLSRYKNYWNRNNQQASQPNQIQYVALGDSTAQGIGATSASKGYVGIIAEEVAKREGRPVQTTNLSKSGAKVKDVVDTQLAAFKKLDTNDDTIVTIQIGANDMINFEASRFESEMDQVMAQLPKQTLITDMPYFAQSRFKNKQPNVVVANEIMYRLANKHGFKLVALNKRMQENGGIKTFAPDWFHPSNTAYRENWAHVFLARL